MADQSEIHFPCQFFRELSTKNWELMCTRATKVRPEFSPNTYFCDVHYEGIHSDPGDWSFEVLRDMSHNYMIITHNNEDQHKGRRCVHMPELGMSNSWRILKTEDGRELPPKINGCLLEHGISFDPPSYSQSYEVDEEIEVTPEGVTRKTKRADGSWDTIFLPRKLIQAMWEELQEVGE